MTTDSADRLPGLGRRSVEHLLRDLNELRAKKSVKPLITLHLRGAAHAEGWLLDFGVDEDRKDAEPVALLLVGGPHSRPGDDVMFVPLREIQAVNVHDAPEVGKHFRPVPTRMSVRRIADDIARMLSEKTGRRIAADLSIEKVAEASLQTLADDLETLKSALTELASDPTGRKTFRDDVRALAIKAGALGVVPLKGGSLTITLPSDESASSAAAKGAIETVL